MARYKPAGSKKVKAATENRGFIPCLIVLVGGFAILSILLYAVLKGS
jgi:hypothetical protein